MKLWNGEVIVGLGIALLVSGCPKAPRWEDQKVSCETSADCRERFEGSEAVDARTLYCSEVGFCVQVPDAECDTAEECPIGAPGRVWCDQGSWACNLGRCELTCVGCDEDADRDGYGVGEGCAGLDCDDTLAQVHDRTVRTCYEGPEWTGGLGACRSGQQWCEAGLWQPCAGQVLPAQETCNGLDDDCDGATDGDLPMPACGLGVCRSAGACEAGALQACRPGAPNPAGESDQVNGLDDDCDGVVDNLTASAGLPDCIFVAPSGYDSASQDGQDPTQPFLTVPFALAAAERQAQQGAPLALCVAGGRSCGQTVTGYSVDDDLEPLTLVDGVSILGSYESTTWTRCPNVTTLLATHHDLGIYVPPEVRSPTTLSRMALRRVGPDQVGITIDGARNFTLSEVMIGPAEVPETLSTGMEILNGAEVIADHLQVHGGAGTAASIGIRVEGSRLELTDSCPVDPGTGRCGSCNGVWAEGIHAVSASAGSLNAVAIELIDARDSTLDRVSLCDLQADAAAGVVITGDARGVRLRQSHVDARGAGRTAVGVAAYCEERGAPEVAFNEAILAEATVGGAGSSVLGILVGRECDPEIHDNARIAARAAVPQVELAVGVLCDGIPATPEAGDPGTASQCRLVRNQAIAAGDVGASPLGAVGVVCAGGACALLEQNDLQGATAGGGSFLSLGLALSPGSRPLVARNTLLGGCADTDRSVGGVASTSLGVDAIDSGARLENNAILGGHCAGDNGGPAIGMRATLRSRIMELDVNGNTIDGGESSVGAIGVAFQSVEGAGIVRGVFRNNLIRPGRTPLAAAFALLTGGVRPRILTSNLVWRSNPGQALGIDYGDPAGTQTAMNLAALEALISAAAGTLEGDPLLARPDSIPLDPHLQPGSACMDAGTHSGAPLIDFDGAARNDAKIDIGADELGAP